MTARVLLFLPLALALVALAAACGSGTTRPSLPNANAGRGKALITYYGCGACHVIGGLATANGHVGPDLTTFPGRNTIAGKLPNTAANLARWIENPQKIAPGTDMPVLGIGPKGAADIAAYLYSQ
jgi:cytochrome c